jgi:hypothetical protein
MERGHHWKTESDNRQFATVTETRHQRGSSVLLELLCFVLVLANPLSATPLFSQHGLRALFDLVVSCRGVGKSHQSKICRKAPVIRQCTKVPPCRCGDGFVCHRVSPDLSANGKSHSGHGSFRRDT